jgi:hypothetical protein
MPDREYILEVYGAEMLSVKEAEESKSRRVEEFKKEVCPDKRHLPPPTCGVFDA